MSQQLDIFSCVLLDVSIHMRCSAQQCKGIFGAVILVDSSKDSSHAGKSSLCVMYWLENDRVEQTQRETGQAATKSNLCQGQIFRTEGTSLIFQGQIQKKN